MGFKATSISYRTGWVRVFHDYYPHCKDMNWEVKGVTCLPHKGFSSAHSLDETKWKFSLYQPTTDGYSAKLALQALVPGTEMDDHLRDRFDRGGCLSLYIVFNNGNGPNSGCLELQLKP